MIKSSSNPTLVDDDVHIVQNEQGENIYIFDPHNPLNIEINKSDVETILSNYGIDVPIHNFQLYRRAFVHRSYTRRPDLENIENNIEISVKPNECLPLYTKSNERLEFIGDGVLECITKYYLYRRFPKADEGFMTEKKIALVKNESIGRMAYEMGLNKWFVMSKNAETKQTRTNLKKLGCLFEAFIGAMFLDFNRIKIDDEYGWFKNVFSTGPGLQMAQTFIENVFEKHVDWTKLINYDDNFKNILQVIIQKEFKLTPDYVEIKDPSINYDEIDISDKTYAMGIYISFGQNIHNANIDTAIKFDKLKTFKAIHELLEKNDKLLVFLTKAEHKIKKKAEQMACENAIKLIEKIN